MSKNNKLERHSIWRPATGDKLTGQIVDSASFINIYGKGGGFVVIETYDARFSRHCEYVVFLSHVSLRNELARLNLRRGDHIEIHRLPNKGRMYKYAARILIRGAGEEVKLATEEIRKKRGDIWRPNVGQRLMGTILDYDRYENLRERCRVRYAIIEADESKTTYSIPGS